MNVYMYECKLYDKCVSVNVSSCMREYKKLQESLVLQLHLFNIVTKCSHALSYNVISFELLIFFFLI